MKRKLPFLTAVAAIALVLGAFFFSLTAFAESGFTVTYVSENGDVLNQTVVPTNSTIDKFLSYAELNLSEESAEGQELVFYYGDTGEIATAPLKIDRDITLIAVVGKTVPTVSYTYRYCGKEEVRTYLRGARAEEPRSFGGYAATGIYYADENFTEHKYFPAVAEQDEIFYPLIEKEVAFSFNGVSYSCPYGSRVTDIAISPTHKIANAFLDVKLTEEFSKPVTVSLALFGEAERISYAVTLAYSDSEENVTVYVPAGKELTRDMIPEEYSDASWYLSNAEKVNFPFAVTEDLTLYATADKAKISHTDYIILYVTICAVAAAIIAGSVCEIIKKKKQEKNKHK